MILDTGFLILDIQTLRSLILLLSLIPLNNDYGDETPEPVPLERQASIVLTIRWNNLQYYSVDFGGRYYEVCCCSMCVGLVSV